ncbi:amidohydrolase [Pontibacillus salicampi]|uniref:Amidohydrolase n=1 Tax=Pontibacillus salicampi TaxID=1449801 RepID=A0ABV6LPS8_9BACI
MPASDFIEEIKPKLIDWRRYFHQNPELGFLEYNTTYRLAKELESLGFSLWIGKDALKSDARYGVPGEETVREHEQKAAENGIPSPIMEKMVDGHTGVVARISAPSPGKHTAYRFDIDALPITESQESTHLPAAHSFRSAHEGIMHACGHDGHMAIGLGLATYISAHIDQLKGSFTLLFQPAEEGGRGAMAMTDRGWLHDVDEFYTGHIGIQSLPVGCIAATTNGFLASSKLDATFTGKASHAGMKPEEGHNALLAAATAATQLYAIPRHSGGASRINVGKLEAGRGRNIIGDHGFLEIETRGSTKAINEYMEAQANRVLTASAAMHASQVDITSAGRTEEIQCSPELASYVQESCENSLYVTKILRQAAVSGSEDASFMINAVQQQGGKATYMLFGTPLPHTHHHPAFDFDEEVLTAALDTFIHIVKGGGCYD